MCLLIEVLFYTLVLWDSGKEMRSLRFLMQFHKQALYLLLQMLSFIHLGQANSKWQAVLRQHWGAACGNCSKLIVIHLISCNHGQIFHLSLPSNNDFRTLGAETKLCVCCFFFCVYVNVHLGSHHHSPRLNDRFLFSLSYLLFPFSSWQPSLSAEYCYHFFILILSLAAYIITPLFQNLDTYPLIH